MPQPNPPFTYVQPTFAIPAVRCPHCGAVAHVMRRSPLPDDPASEIRTFECRDCRQQTEIIVHE